MKLKTPARIDTIPLLGRKLCPVCGKPSYSQNGIHPQCAVKQSEVPRNLLLRAQRAKQADVKKVPKQRSWVKKCPKCGTDVHVRLGKCACGHAFNRP